MVAICLICDAPSRSRCSQCHNVAYCSSEHQAQDWPAHKAYCKLVSTPGITTYDAILFGVNETRPRMIKLPWSWGADYEELEPEERYQMLEKQPWYSERSAFVRTLFIDTFGATPVKLGYTLAVQYDDHFKINGSPVNRCIQAIMGGEAAIRWAGNVMALRAEDMYVYRHGDAILEKDLAPMMEFFKDYGKQHGGGMRFLTQQPT
ncbi:uncharacterized protein EV420DRAFT_1132043 [Desarmillaria tabescens]|uniref:MYND-type domain-containing protein n=1 Tax=Armillaria tabescens TaxID=1929756 RepID=A0AA39MMP2_ARMTA|nr:uncharacterized protein EV420DRAFT_1132043 [Desarmillaria tabescens]KAK0440446.1 hypothetical protein EV420DRAFT_1132043 [Desarmillaria tabescens]